MTTGERPVAVVLGTGPGNGLAFAQRFSAEGYAVAMVARDASRTARLARTIPNATSFACDVTQADAVEDLFQKISEQLGPVDVLIHNAGKGSWGDALTVGLDDFEQSWQTNVLGALVAARSVLPEMRSRKQGTILFVGATASLRGGAKTAAFASAKAAQRSLAQSLARAYGPDGIHVAVLIIDGIVDEPVMRERMADRPDDFFMQPADIADAAMGIVNQPRSAWTFELDLRPYGETW